MNLFSDRSSIGSHHYTSLWRMFFLLLLVGATPVFIWAVMTQRIELRKRAATSEPVVCWNRVGGTAPNLYWPNGCKGNPTPQMCTQATVPLSATETYKYNEWVADRKPYIPGCGMTPPNTTSINWKTPYAYLLASDMVISANGKVFKGIPTGAMTVHSNPASATYTTLESTWNENGVEMRMFIYFDASTCTKSLPPQCNWRITELRIYNGNTPGDWIYFKGGDVAAVGARVGTEYVNPSLVLTSSENGIGKVVFSNLRLQAFTNQTTMTPPPPTSCLNQRNGAPCSTNSCMATTICSPDGTCEESRTEGRICPLAPGTCQDGRCIATTVNMTCGGIRGAVCPTGYSCVYSNGTTRPQYPDESGKCVLPTKLYSCQSLSTTQSSYFSMCAKQGFSGVCFNKYTGVYQGCTRTGSNDCTVNNMNAAQNILCPVAVTPTPTCIPRPACMDPLPGQPACMIKIPEGGWLCPKVTPTPTCIPRPACMDPLPGQPQCMPDLPPGGWLCPKVTPTPSEVCKTGVSSFSVGQPCKDPNTFVSATYSCQDGYKGTVGGDIRMCQSSAMLAEQAQMACAGRTSCTTVKVGDLNGDNLVNLFDYNILLGNFGKSGAAGSIKGDLNRDGVVNIFDYNILLRNFGK